MSAVRGLLIFDLDGTLMDTRRDIATAVNRMRADYGLRPLSVETITSFVGDGFMELVRRSLSDAPEVNVEEALARCDRYYDERLHAETTLYEGVAEGLRKLKEKGYALALVSNKPREACVKLLRHFGIHDLFDVAVCAGDTSHLKPHPEPIRRVMETLRVPPERTWMIGDHRTDVEAARRAGVSSVFLEEGMGRLGHETPTLCFRRFSDAVNYFLTTLP